MSDAIKKLHDYLAKSPSVVYPEDVLAYLPAIEAENARLRERSAKTLEVGTRWMAKAARFESENDVLRELVKQMHTCLTRPKAYTGASQPYLVATECPHFTQGVCDYNSCGFERRMRELGVEVE